DAGSLRSLFERRAPVTSAMLALGRAAFRAYASPDPQALEILLARGGAALPFLAAAVHCHLGRFPSVASGVDEVEAEPLSALGRDVVAGRADWLAHHPLDRWLGGVHLHSPRPSWRWDGSARRLVLG